MAPYMDPQNDLGEDTLAERSTLHDLTVDLVTQVRTFTKYLDAIGQTRPSHNKNTPTTVLPPRAPEAAHEARGGVMDLALRIYRLAAGPSEYLADLQTQYHTIACLQWLCHFNVFSLVPPSSSISYHELASHAEVTEERLKSVVRMAITSGIFAESTAQQVEHTAISQLLRDNQNFRDWALFMCDISAPTAGSMAEAHKRWPDDLDKTHTAYNVAFGHDLPFFKHLAQTPDRHKQFSGYMRSVTSGEGTHMKHLVNGFDWSKLGKAQVVDVGGSTGQGSIALAEAFPNLDVVVQDLPEVVAEGRQHINSLTIKDIANRISFLDHSFFEPQPIHGADVYLLRMIIHDWSFEDALEILKNIVSVMEPGSRLVIMDTVLPAPGTVGLHEERLLRVRDLTMMQVFNSCERSLEDWQYLLQRVGCELVIDNINQPFGSNMSLLEVRLAKI